MKNVLELSLRQEDKEQEEVLQDGTRIIIEVIEPWRPYERVGRGEAGTEEEETAVHEAEHAVIAIVEGVPVKSASIVAENIGGEDTAGHVELGESSKKDAYAIISATSHGRSGDRLDKQHVEQIHGPGSFARFGAMARERKANNRKKIRRVAGELLKEKKLTGAQIEQIVNATDEMDSENVRVTVIRPGVKEGMVYERKVKKGDVIDISMLAPADLPQDLEWRNEPDEYEWNQEDKRMAA